MSIPTPRTIVKALLSPSIVPGTFFTLIGLGLVPMDDGTLSVAAPFINPLGIPIRPFLLVLGPCKIMGALSLWGIGPMPEWFARGGLALSAACAAYGHSAIGESMVPGIMVIGLIGCLYALDNKEKGKKE
mmetsp:Transcript_13311/g.27963  ORF Transcript_13311/g.27963 Transcript_13311/m.27963 type:complete len:130 (-) Transcript_13311:2727-3116(-)